jgi:hypothetical protein
MRVAEPTYSTDPDQRRSTELWELRIGELTGHNIETEGRKEVNQRLADGWILLHIYTLKYREDGVWRERPMAILGKPGFDHTTHFLGDAQQTWTNPVSCGLRSKTKDVSMYMAWTCGNQL